MSDRSPFSLFVGYARLEEWARVADHARPVYASRFAERSPSYAGRVTEPYDVGVVVSQPDNDGVVHYWRFTAATVTMLYGAPFDGDAPAKRQAQEDVWQLVCGWLVYHRFMIRQGMVAMPKDLRLLAGQATFFAWDKEDKRFRRYPTDRGNAAAASGGDTPTASEDQAP